ncbi:Zinc finger RING/FYVE/PHD-type protein [Dioscorea alata]|uniref:Zinc finger RING/FYVE/PHD-type protein n=1 Tax=Dioscorea alata TaxID=55571 RepID=A0ACB7US46_DIOAL|nr:Zinc finger RING/FYVE/PHD-type protein [Dioscorea alata]
MEVVQVPPYFLCPISLEIMSDPVTLSTGITYERKTIEKWMFTDKHNTCPVTKQPVFDYDFTPNHNLRRLIQAWCATNASFGVERFPTPRPPVTKTDILSLLNEAKKPEYQINSLKKLRMIVLESDRNKHCVESAPGALDFLISIIKKNINSFDTSACDEALMILSSIQISAQGLLNLIRSHDDLIHLFTSVMKKSNYQNRVHATLVLNSLIEATAPSKLIALKDELFIEVVKVLSDQISAKATKSALKILAQLCPLGRNRVKAAEACAVSVLVELLIDEPERKTCEIILMVLDQLCGCAEGRAEMVGHAAGIAIISKKVLRVSCVATEKAVRILHSVSKFSATPAVLQEMLNVGAVSKLCMAVQVDCGLKTKEKAKEILKLHSRVWRNSPCIAYRFQGSYPS